MLALSDQVPTWYAPTCIRPPHPFASVRRGSAARRGTAHAHGCWSRSPWPRPGLPLEEALALASSLRRAQRTCGECVHGCPPERRVACATLPCCAGRPRSDELSSATRCEPPMLCPEGWLDGFTAFCGVPRLALPLGRPSCLVGQDHDDERDDDEYDDERRDGRDERAVRALPLAS